MTQSSTSYLCGFSGRLWCSEIQGNDEISRLVKDFPNGLSYLKAFPLESKHTDLLRNILCSLTFFLGCSLFLLGIDIGIMRAFGFWVLFFLVGTALVCLSFSGQGSTSSSPGMVFTHRAIDMTMTPRSRKLKDNGSIPSIGKDNAGNVELEDYNPIDPVPSSKASVRPGPIQHGTPLMPFIPKPSPPGHPKHGVYTSPAPKPPSP